MNEALNRNAMRLRSCFIVFVIAVCSSLDAWADTAPILLTKPNTSRAIALDSMTFIGEPFQVISPAFVYGEDRRTRVSLYVKNITLQPGEPLSAVRVDAMDFHYRHYNLDVEYVGKVPGYDWLTMVVVRLHEDLNNVGDVLVRLFYRGIGSNRARIGIGRVGGGPPGDELFNVLEFDGTPQAVVFKDFWGPGDLGHFFWEFWAMPAPGNDGGLYLLSDGYGGAHALLFGTGYSGYAGRVALYGNTWDGNSVTNFGGDDGPAHNEWAHLAVGWDGTKIVTYYNGVPVGMAPFSGPRRTPGPSGGAGTLYIGGSDHQNFLGRISQVRGYEGSNPRREIMGGGQALAAFAPQTVFTDSGDFLLSFLRRVTNNINDLSGSARVGHLRGTAYRAGNPPQLYPPPRFVVDQTAPTASAVSNPTPPANLVDSPAPVPYGARVFDSFSRRNATLAFDDVGGLGTTEGGTAGRQEWQYDKPADEPLAPFGILNGRAVVLANSAQAAWVGTGDGPANLDIRVDRRWFAGGWGSGVSTGIVFRLRDASNFFSAYTTGTSFSDQKLVVSYRTSASSGNLTSSGGVAMPGYWVTLRVVTLSSGSIKVYADDTLVFSTTSNLLTNETKAGLWNFSSGQGLANRWNNFTVFDAQP